ncbi:MAG: polysaccharide biosynthesis/export family protein [Planctomycetes bacterium]|nr:polysaccharide biosynthesis/export family protein [Planctomycetota bacterium]
MALRWIAIVCAVMSWSGGVMCPAAEPPAYVIEAPDILKVEATGLRKDLPQMASHDYLVRPDGTLSLGPYGSVRVSELTAAQAQAAIGKHLSQYARKKRAVEVRVAVVGYNSKYYYVVRPGGGGEEVSRLPLTGNETVLDAVGQVEGLAALAAKGRIEVVRDGKVFAVNWRAITRRDRLATNYQLMPGDLVRVAGASE